MNNEPLDPVMGLMLMVFVIVVPYMGYRYGQKATDEEKEKIRKGAKPYWWFLGIVMVAIFIGGGIHNQKKEDALKACMEPCFYAHRTAVKSYPLFKARYDIQKQECEARCRIEHR